MRGMFGVSRSGFSARVLENIVKGLFTTHRGDGRCRYSKELQQQSRHGMLCVRVLDAKLK